MSKTTILALDDDPQVLAAVVRDLRQRYGKDRRIVRATSGAEALASLAELKGRAEDVALIISDQRMPEMTGTEFLGQSREHYPEAKTILLTAYSDTEAAISAINDVGLDHYLVKPWDPPEERFYPIVDELLEEWDANHPPAFSGVRVIDTRWSPAAHERKDFLARNRIPYRFLDIDRDPDAKAIFEAEPAELPLLVLEDGTRLSAPDIPTLSKSVGLHTAAENPFYDLVIIGAGPAGLGAAVYGASEGLRTMLVERAATGGQAGTSSRIENYLGFPKGISGSDLATRATTQAQRLGAEILTGPEVVGVEVADPVKTVLLADGTQVGCHALIVASGMEIRRIGVDTVEDLVGAGVYYGAAPSEAAAYRGEPVFVVGAANSAGQAAMMLSKYAGRVTVLARGDTLTKGMSAYLIDQIDETPNIDVRLHSQVAGAGGEGRLEWMDIRHSETDDIERVDAQGLFIFIGAVPHSGFVEGVVARDRRGFILTGPDLRVDGALPPEWPLERDPLPMETNVPGIFAAGDVRSGVVRRVASAVGQGAIAVSLVHQYLDTV